MVFHYTYCNVYTAVLKIENTRHVLIPLYTYLHKSGHSKSLKMKMRSCVMQYIPIDTVYVVENFFSSTSMHHAPHVFSSRVDSSASVCSLSILSLLYL